MKNYKLPIPSIFGYLFFPLNGIKVRNLIPPSQKLFESLSKRHLPYFFVHEFDCNNIDLENIHPVDVANQLVHAGLLIDTNISYN